MAWHIRLEHTNFGLIDKLCKRELVDGLPKLKFTKDKICSACLSNEKTRKVIFKLKNKVLTFIPLELIHMNLFGPTRVVSLGRMYYTYVLVDDYYVFHSS